MKDQPIIIRDNHTLSTQYNQLSKDDIICTRVRMHYAEESILTDLLERGIRLIPSATAQLASRSKVFQAKIFSDYMLPDTLAIYNNHMLLEASSLYHKKKYRKVVLKHDRKNAGLGIHLYRDIEDLYNQISGETVAFPFVISPYQKYFKDIRVIILGDYIEAYERINPHNFRKNLHCGGISQAFHLNKKQLKFCQQVMRRGQFDYGHIDLMLTAENNCYLTEINLRGGLRGAKISGKRYKAKLEALHEQLLKQLTSA